MKKDLIYLIRKMTPRHHSENQLVQGDFNLGFDEARERIIKLLIDNPLKT